MITTTSFPYQPMEHEAEKASNSYLMSVIALMAGLPLPIINLIATAMFYIGNRKGPYFVRWHCFYFKKRLRALHVWLRGGYVLFPDVERHFPKMDANMGRRNISILQANI